MKKRNPKRPRKPSIIIISEVLREVIGALAFQVSSADDCTRLLNKLNRADKTALAEWKHSK